MILFKRVRWSLLVAALFLLNNLNISQCLRVKLYPDQEPTSAQAHNNYRMLAADPNYYYLKSAGLLNESLVGKYDLEDYREPNGNFAKGKFIFNSSRYFEKGSVIQWFAPWTEMSALSTYDDPRDRDLATGPQVNQELCGLHLDYMIHLVKKYNTNFSNATELSIFMIMLTYDFPKLGVGKGNYHFLGDYSSCKRVNLNVMRHELVEVNRTAAEDYFNSLAKEQPLKPGALNQILYTIRQYIGPFLGYPKEPERLLMDEYRDKIKPLPMRYCISKMRWPSWPNSSHHLRNDAFKVAVCIPETCDSNSLRLYQDKIKWLARFMMADYYNDFYYSDLYCLPDEQSELRNPLNYLSTVSFIIFNGIWVCLAIIATLMSSKSSNRKQSQGFGWREMLMCWSIKKNTRDFLAAANPIVNQPVNSNSNSNSSKELRVDTAPLEGFKVLSSMSVITSHACILGFTLAWNPRTGHDIISKGWLAMTTTIGPAVVDNFFVVTGIITAKTLFKMPHKVLMSPGFWLKFMIYRYLRIIPLYLLFHWFLQSVFRFLGDGPVWDYGTSHTAWAKMCQDESWWTILLPSANFKSPAVHCNGVGWYLANDLQFALLTPIVIIFLLKKPLIAHISVVVSLSLLMANHILYYLDVEYDIAGLFEVNLMGITSVLDDATVGYVYPQYRYCSVLIGLAAGHLLHLYENGHIKRWPKAFDTYGKAYLIFTTYFICYVPYFGSLVPKDDEQLLRILGAFKNGSIHTVVSIAVAIFILFICTGQLRSISRFLSWRIFRPLANSALCTLLVHIPLLFYYNQGLRTLPELSTYFIVTSVASWATQSLVVSVLVHILYELPMRRFLVNSLTALLADNKVRVEQDKKEKTK